MTEKEKARHLGEFKLAVNKLCAKYGVSISHEDHHGAFQIEKYCEYNIRWFNQATWSNEEGELE